MGWMFLYAGATKLMDPNFSAAGYMNAAKTFPGLYQWLASPSMLPAVNFLNAWGLTLLGIALILGVCMRLSSTLGAVLMLLYYLPILQWPYPNTHAYIVDEHIIYIFGLLTLAAFNAGRAWGIQNWIGNLSFVAGSPRLKAWLS